MDSPVSIVLYANQSGAAGPDTSDQLLQFIRLTKEVFWRDNHNLAEAEIQRLWAQRTAHLNSELGFSHSSQIDRSDSVATRTAVPTALTSAPMVKSHTEPTLPSPEAFQMNRPRSHVMKRKFSSPSTLSPFSNTRQISPVSMRACLAKDDQSSIGDVGPTPCKSRRTAWSQKQLPRIPEVKVRSFEPADYIKQNVLESRDVNSYLENLSGLSHVQDCVTVSETEAFSMPQISATQISTHSLHSPLSSTPALNDLSDLSTSSYAMERTSSDVRSSLCGGLDLMRIRSQGPSVCDLQRGAQGSHDCIELPSYISVPPAHGFSNSFSSPLVDCEKNVTQVISSLPQFSNPSMYQMPLTSCTVADELAQEQAQVSEVQIRGTPRSRRRPEPSTSIERLIAPKSMHVFENENPSPEHNTPRKSADGTKYQISKATFIRPSREKVKCGLCNKHPEGFRGRHELSRHTERAHNQDRRVWICIDASPGKDMLANCKSCRTHKRYGAYYNAAAHLRRCHFNPKKEGRRGKGGADRAGKGGGDQPPIEELKKHWMKEVEEHLPRQDDMGADLADASDETEQSELEQEVYLSADSSLGPQSKLTTTHKASVGLGEIQQPTELDHLDPWPYDMSVDAMFDFPLDFSVSECGTSIPSYETSLMS